MSMAVDDPNAAKRGVGEVSDGCEGPGAKKAKASGENSIPPTPPALATCAPSHAYSQKLFLSFHKKFYRLSGPSPTPSAHIPRHHTKSSF